MKTRRLFFALWPEPAQRDRLRDAINSVARNVEGRTLDRQNWHVTLAYVGVFPERRLPILYQKAAEIAVEPFRLSFDRLEFWPKQKIAVLAAVTVPPELQRLVDSLSETLASVGIRPEEHNYRPHVTVARNARPFATERLSRRLEMEWFKFELMESVSAPGGSRYYLMKQ